MLTNISVLDSVQECNQIISDAQNRINTLTLRKSVLLLKQTNSAAYVIGLETELASTVQLITQLNEQIAAMAEGPEKEDKEIELVRADLRRRSILKSLRTSNPESIIERDITIARIDAETVVYQTVISEVETHSDTLPA